MDTITEFSTEPIKGSIAYNMAHEVPNILFVKLIEAKVLLTLTLVLNLSTHRIIRCQDFMTRKPCMKIQMRILKIKMMKIMLINL